MADISAVKSNIITGFVADADAILTAVVNAKARRQLAIDLGFASGPLILVDGDFTGENNHLTANQLFDGANVINDLDVHLAATVNTVARDRYIKLSKLLRSA